MGALTILKNVSDAPKEWRRHRIVSIMTRDAIWAFIIIGGEKPLVGLSLEEWPLMSYSASCVVVSILYKTTIWADFINMFIGAIFSYVKPLVKDRAS